MVKKTTYKALVFVVVVAIAFGMIPVHPCSVAYAGESRFHAAMIDDSQQEISPSSYVQAATGVSKPRIVVDAYTDAGQIVTWDCVWLGSYPQSEITTDSPVYSSFSKASWDENGDTTIDNAKYRRLSKTDTTSSHDFGDIEYRYFKYEPIKWRVLSVSGDNAFVVADTALDDQRYNSKLESVTWKTCSIRSWLNGYSASENKSGIDFTSNSFINTAFSSDEQAALYETTVVNKNNSKYGTAGGLDTQDKVFLLSESEVCSLSAAQFGFATNDGILDEARRCKMSTYANAMGATLSTDSSYRNNKISRLWLLRSPGKGENYAMSVRDSGLIAIEGITNSDQNCAIRPALHLNLKNSSVKNAGTLQSVNKPASSLTLFAQTKPYTGKVVAYSGKYTQSGSKGKITYAYYYDAACTKPVSAANVKNVGDYYVKGTVAADANYMTATSAAVKFTITKAASSLMLFAQTKPYTGKAVAYSGKYTQSGSKGKITYAYYYDAACTKPVSAANVKNVGDYYVKGTVEADANYAATANTVKFTISKATNTMKVSAKLTTVKYSKKKASIVSAAKVYNFTKRAVGKITFSRVAKGSSKWLSKVNKKTGAITAKANAPKGKTQKIKVKISAKGNANYKPANKVLTVKIKIK